RSKRPCARLKKAVTVTARKPTRKSVWSASRRARSRPCRWTHRNGASICRSRWETEERLPLAQRACDFLLRGQEKSHPPARRECAETPKGPEGRRAGCPE